MDHEKKELDSDEEEMLKEQEKNEFAIELDLD